MLDEPEGEVVEQFRVRGQFAQAAEIVDRAHEAPAEDVVPEPVDHDAGGERVVGRGKLLGKFQPAAARGTERRRVERLEVTPGHGGFRAVVVPARIQRLVEARGFQQSRGPPRDGHFPLGLAVLGDELSQAR